jgi:flagellar biosynthesis protein FlhG
MNEKKSSPKVIRLSDRIAGKNGSADGKPFRGGDRCGRIMAFTSGKGGVGKTNIVANLGYALTRLGLRVLVLDADLGLGNMDVLLGKAPRYNLSHFIFGDKLLDDVTMTGPGGMRILPASSGIQDLTRLTPDQHTRVLSALDELMGGFDLLLIDTAAGISSNVMYFNLSANEIIVVATPEPTSITDAYALMKVLSLKYNEHCFKLLVNMARDDEEARDVHRQLNLVAGRFLDIDLAYLGCVFHDDGISKCVRHQRVLSEMAPDSRAGRCFADLARTVSRFPATVDAKGDQNPFWKSFFQNKPDRLDRF